MLVLNHNGTVYMAYAGEESDVKLKDNCPMWHAGKHKKTLLGVFGSERLADVLRYEKIVSGPISKNNLVLTTVPVVRAIADDFGLLKDTTLVSNVYVAEGDKAYKICSDGSVFKIEKVYSDHMEIAMGAYDSEEISDPYEYIRKFAIYLAEISGRETFPQIVMNTKDGSVAVIKKEKTDANNYSI